MSMPFRIGLAGLSETSAPDLLPALRSACTHRGGQLVAVSAHDPERALELLFGNPAVTIHDTAAEMLVGEVLDGLVIADPDNVPDRVALAALRQGVHVLLTTPTAAAAPATLQHL